MVQITSPNKTFKSIGFAARAKPLTCLGSAPRSLRWIQARVSLQPSEVLINALTSTDATATDEQKQQRTADCKNVKSSNEESHTCSDPLEQQTPEVSRDKERAALWKMLDID